MRPTHHHWRCPRCNRPKPVEIAVAYLYCVCGTLMDYDADAEIAEYATLMAAPERGPECTAAG